VIVGEEDGTSRESAAQALAKACWVIDPLDGTFNFVHGYPDFSSTVAYVEAGQPVAGCVYASVLDEMFSAAKGLGATLNGEPIAVSRRRGLANAIVNLSINALTNEEYIARTLAVRQHAFSQKGFGGTALVLAYLAAGRYDLFYSAPNPRVGPWDVAAGALLVEEAGGVTGFVDGRPFSLPAPSMTAAADQATLDDLLALLS
jgi:myo-inositol-1(or 4)-monophosphatase